MNRVRDSLQEVDHIKEIKEQGRSRSGRDPRSNGNVFCVTKRDYLERNKRCKEKEISSGDFAVVEDGYESVDVLLVTTEKPHDEWILDSTCSFHMSPYRDWFCHCDFTRLDGGKVLMGNDVACQLESIGSIKFKLSNGTTKILSEVRFVTRLK